MSEERAGLDAREARRAEREMLQTIDERDRAEAAADELAYAIAPMEVIGEHSNLNDPWRNALEEVGNLRAEAVAAYKTGFAEAVRALPRLAWVHDGMDGLTGTQPDGRYLDRAAVLALLEPKP